MGIALRCPCGRDLVAGESQGGTIIRCPFCGSELLVPQAPPPPFLYPVGEVAVGGDSFPEGYACFQEVADARSVLKRLHSAGIGGIIFGAIAVWLGASSVQVSLINAILLLLGVFLIAESIYVLAKPNPRGLLLDGIALITVGAWNLLITLLNLAAGEGWGLSVLAILGVLQVFWGIQRIRESAAWETRTFVKPSRELLERVDRMVMTIIKAKVKDVPESVEFIFGSVAWKGWLSGDAALFVKGTNQRVIVAQRSCVEVQDGGKSFVNGRPKITLLVNGETLRGTTTPESLERCVRWKSAV